MIKIILIAISVLLPSVLLAQLRGMYCSHTTLSTECITFNEGNNFEVSFYGCLGFQYGKGFYEKQKNKLILNFIRHPDDSSMNCITIDTIPSLPKDSVIIFDFQVYNEREEPFESVIIRFGTLGTNTNASGYGKLLLSKSDKVITCHVQYIGYHSNAFSIKLDKNYKIKIVLLPELGVDYIKQGEVLRYKLKKVDANGIVLKQKGVSSSFYKKEFK